MSAICDEVETLTRHFTILNYFVGEVLPVVDMVGSFTPANDVVTLLNAPVVVLVDRGGLLLPESAAEQNCPEVRDLIEQPVLNRTRPPLRIFDFHVIGALLYIMIMPDVDLLDDSDVDLWEELLPLSA
jgi:hypothetical protein